MCEMLCLVRANSWQTMDLLLLSLSFNTKVCNFITKTTDMTVNKWSLCGLGWSSRKYLSLSYDLSHQSIKRYDWLRI